MTTTTVWKYEVPVDDEIVVDMGKAALIRWLHVEPLGRGRLTLWAQVQPRGWKMPEQTLYVRGTGRPMTGDEGRHVGTVIAPPFVWHVFAERDAEW